MNKDYTPSIQASEAYQRIVAYLRTTRPGQLVTYAMIEDATGVTMDRRNRKRLPTAFQALGIAYDNKRDIGYQLTDARLAVPHVERKKQCVVNAVGRLRWSVNIVSEQFSHEFTPAEREAFKYQVACTTTIEFAIEKDRQDFARALAKVKAISQHQATIVLPDNSPAGQ